jgi:hypothetical protein
VVTDSADERAGSSADFIWLFVDAPSAAFPELEK